MGDMTEDENREGGWMEVSRYVFNPLSWIDEP